MRWRRRFVSRIRPSAINSVGWPSSSGRRPAKRKLSQAVASTDFHELSALTPADFAGVE